MSNALDLASEYAEPYLQRADRVLGAICTYNGSEDRYQELIDSLIDLEQWMVSTFGNGTDFRRLSDEMEKAITRQYSPDQTEHTISDFIDLARDHFSQLMQGEGSPEEVIRRLPILHVQLEETLLPPGEAPRPQIGSGEGWRPTENTPRLQMLIQLLQENGIYTDDLIVVSGVNTPSMMRKESYALIEIPRIAKEALVCNQLGEATFISERPLGRNTYTRCTKEELLALPGIHRIVFDNPEQWTTDVQAVLFREGEVIGRKVNVRDQEEMRSAITEIYTSGQWANMTGREKDQLTIHGRKLMAIAGLFGVEWQGNQYSFFELGARIYGEDDPCIQPKLAELRLSKNLDGEPQRWADAIRATYTAEQWASMTAKQRLKFRVHGKGLNYVSSVFGVEGDPIGYERVHLMIGAKIYGREHPALRERLNEEERMHEIGDSQERWKDIIKGKLGAEQWVKMTAPERHALTIEGRGLTFIARVFGIGQNAIYNSLPFIELGERIFGPEPAITQLLSKLRTEAEQQERLGEDRGKWRAEILARISPQAWLRTKSADRKQVQIAGFGLMRIGGIFGLKGNPKSDNLLYRELGNIIYGADVLSSVEAEMRSADQEELRVKIIAQIPVADWLHRTAKDRKDILVDGKGLRAIAGTFCIEGDARNNTAAYTELARRIYGDEAVRSILENE